MTPARKAFVAVAVTPVVCIMILIGRMHRERQVEKTVRQAVARPDYRAPGKSVKLVNLWSGADQVLWMEEGMVRGPKRIPVWIDESIHRVLFSAMATTSKCSFILIQPNGMEFQPSSATYRLSVEHGGLLEVIRPVPGVWTLEMDVPDFVQVVVRGEGELSLERAEVLPATAHDDAGAQARADCCGPGAPAQALLRLVGPRFPDAEIRLLTEDGEVFAKMHPIPVKPEAGGGPGLFEYNYTVRFPFPTVPFRILIAGQDHGHLIFERVSEELFQPQLPD